MAAPRQVALFLLATQFLTRLPVPSARDYQPQWLQLSLRYFPLVGGLVGLINVAVWWLARHWFPQSVAVGLMLAASLLVTGAFHEDGFADACDGLGGGDTRERTLAIMKDSRIGAFGALGVMLLLGLKWSALIALPTAAFAVVLVAAHVMSRWCALGLVWGLRYARAEGEGKSRPFDAGLSLVQWVLSGVIGVAAIAIPATAFGPFRDSSLALPVLAGCTAAMLSAFVAAAYLKRRIGGYTGDTLGAVQQLSELTFVLASLAVLRSANPL